MTTGENLLDTEIPFSLERARWYTCDLCGGEVGNTGQLHPIEPHTIRACFAHLNDKIRSVKDRCDGMER